MRSVDAEETVDATVKMFVEARSREVRSVERVVLMARMEESSAWRAVWREGGEGGAGLRGREALVDAAFEGWEGEAKRSSVVVEVLGWG